MKRKTILSLLIVFAISTFGTALRAESDRDATANTGIIVGGASGAAIGLGVGALVAGPIGAAAGTIIGGAAGSLIANEGNRRYRKAIKKRGLRQHLCPTPEPCTNDFRHSN